MHVISLAQRTRLPPDPIDDIFTEIPGINTLRAQSGLPAIINLTVGEPHLNINPAILEDFVALLNNPSHLNIKYSPLAGAPETRNAITALYNNYYPNANYSTEEVMICNGATQGIWNALSLLIDNGDIALVFEPCYSNYTTQVKILGGTVIKIPTLDNHFRPTAQSLNQALLKYPNAKVLILNYPNNPSGIDLTKEEIIAVADILHEHPNIAIIIDDVYRELTYNDHLTVIDVKPSLKNRTIVVNSASKGLIGAPGIRAGMIGANARWIKQMTNLQAMAVCSISSLTEKVLTLGIKHKLSPSSYYHQWLQDSIKAYEVNKKYFSEELQALDFDVVLAEQGFFVLAKYNKMNAAIPDDIAISNINHLPQKIGSKQLNTDHHLAAYLLHAAGVAVVPGSAFAIDEKAGYLRFSCAKPLVELKQAIASIKTALAYLKVRNEQYVEA